MKIEKFPSNFQDSLHLPQNGGFVLKVRKRRIAHDFIETRPPDRQMKSVRTYENLPGSG